jgi:hypothetical protein
MQNKLILVIICSSIFACNHQVDKKDNKTKKKALFGTFNKNNYSNLFFNLNVTFQESWELDTLAIRSINYGGELFNVSYIDSNFSDYPINIVVSADKANPFGSKSPLEKLKESTEVYEMIYDTDEIQITPFDQIAIAGKEYAHAFFKLIDETDTSYVHEYYRYQDGFFLSIICTYNTYNDEAKVMNFIHSIREN